MLKLAMLISCGCVLLGSSSVTTIAAASVPAELVGNWLAEDISGRGVIDYLQTTLEINEDGTYSGFAGCNSYTGAFALEAGTITFGPAASTRKMCPPAVMDQESKFFEVLKSGLSWTIEGTKLVLSKPGSTTGLRLAEHEISAEVTLTIPGATGVDRQVIRYDCGGRPVSADYINAGAMSLVLLSIDGDFVVASNVVSASGAKYMGGRHVWWTKGDTATLIDVMKGEDDPGVACTTSE